MERLSVQIERSDIDATLKTHLGNKVLADVLKRWTEIDLVYGLAQYIHFNSVFGGGVANLAGEIARRKDLFRDSSEQIEMLADQSVEIAAKIFFAAIDEFGRRKTHRTMAKETLKALIMHSRRAGKNISVAEATNNAIEDVSHGYCLNREVVEADIFRAIGFHMGSELLADEEFNIIDRFLQANHEDLVQCLKNENAYTWIQVHTTVEADHFDAAVESANCALEYYVGSAIEAKAWILQGFHQFASVQSQFMDSLQDIKLSEQEKLSRPLEMSSHLLRCRCA